MVGILFKYLAKDIFLSVKNSFPFEITNFRALADRTWERHKKIDNFLDKHWDLKDIK